MNRHSTMEYQRRPLRGLGAKQTVQTAMAATGTSSPSAALRVLKTTQNKKFSYLPHVGEKQRNKHRLRILKQLVDIPTPDGDKRGFTGLQLLAKPDIGDFVKAHPELFTPAFNMDAVFIIEAT